ncbi:MAG TPA: hypothetical protein PLY93_02390 [Turneriella sp.]|nr:hypothetical protein [Turneriella sp.]
MSREHSNYLEYTSSGSYTNGSVEKLFNKLDKYGNIICDMLYHNIEYDKGIATDFSEVLNFEKPKKHLWYADMLPALIAGCANFYRMNDRGVHKVFRILEGLYPEKKDCFTVGFTQFYMMYEEMQCARMVSIDADWRILRAHYEFQKNVREKTPSDTFLTMLQKINVNWLLSFDRPPRAKEVVRDISTFCMDTEYHFCKKAFENYITLDSIPPTELMLGFIHDLTFTPEEKRTTSVIFMSNALDDDYTSLEHFDKLLSRTRETLHVGQKAAFVYQAGDSEDIVVYELFKSDKDELNVSIRCRDNIRWSDQYVLSKRGKPFNTHFDDLLELRKLRRIPRCHQGGTKDYNDPKKSKKYLDAEKKNKLKVQKEKRKI